MYSKGIWQAYGRCAHGINPGLRWAFESPRRRSAPGADPAMQHESHTWHSCLRIAKRCVGSWGRTGGGSQFAAPKTLEGVVQEPEKGKGQERREPDLPSASCSWQHQTTQPPPKSCCDQEEVCITDILPISSCLCIGGASTLHINKPLNTVRFL